MRLLSANCEKPGLYSPLTLAFIGDAVYNLLARDFLLCQANRPTAKLHQMSISIVSANAQAKAYEKIKNSLTEEEAAVFRRGRNAHPGHSPKNVGHAVYGIATGVEALFGWLYLSESISRAEELFLLANK